MLFHIASQHNYETCKGSLAFKGVDVPPRSERQRWIEGNDKVKIIGAYGYQTQHRYYAIVEANDYDDVRELFSVAGHMRNGEVEVVPINDIVAVRKALGEWGQ